MFQARPGLPQGCWKSSAADVRGLSDLSVKAVLDTKGVTITVVPARRVFARKDHKMEPSALNCKGQAEHSRDY